MKLAGSHTQTPPPPVETAFVGARLCGCVVINRFIMDGTYGRGWEATYTAKAQSRKVFVKTLGSMSAADEKSRVFHSKEKAARVEAGVLLHKWFPMAVDHPGAVTARLCYGELTHQTGVSYGNIFFVCGELCSRGELWEYHPYKLAFKERYAKRMFGQLARGVLRMKYCSGSADSGGCFHRDLKMENVIVNEDFDAKITDYGSLKFTDDALKKTSPGGTDFHLANTPGLGTDIYRPPAFFYQSSRALRQHGYDPAGWDVWSLGVMLMMMTTADYLSSTGDTHGRTPTAEEMPTLKAMEAKRVELTNTLVSFHAKDAAKAAALAGVVQQLKQEIVKLRMKQGGVGLGGDAYNFMLLAMREYSGPDPSKPTIQPTQPGQETFESWAKERLVVGEERAGIFYETDHFGRPLRVDINGMPVIERDSRGVPKNRQFWRLLKDIDPDAGDRNGHWTPLSHALKNLINRMLDVDPRTRIKIDEVCKHPFLADHQAPDPAVPAAAVETIAQRAAFTTEMVRRHVTYVNTVQTKREYSIESRHCLENVAEVAQTCLRRGMYLEPVREVDTDHVAAGITGCLKVLVALQQRAETSSALMFVVCVGKDSVKIEWPNTSLKVEVAEWVRFTAAMERGLWDLSHAAVLSTGEANDAAEAGDASNGDPHRASTA